MTNMGVHLSVDDGVSPVQLHDRWLWLFRRRSEVARAASGLFRQWKSVEICGESAEADRLWSEYSALQSEFRVLSAWTDLVHTAWVFATDGRECRFVTGGAPVMGKTLVSAS